MRDATIVLSREDMLDILEVIDIKAYKDTFITIDSEIEYYYVSSCCDGEMLCIEDILTSEGNVKYDETDVLIIPSYLPNEIKEQILQGGYDELIVIE